MTEVNKDPSGMPEVDPVDNQGNQEADPAGSDTVSRRAYQKALTEKKAAQARLQKLEAEAAQRMQEQLDKDGSLQEKLEFYKTKLDEKDNELSTVRTELTSSKEQWNTTRKIAACKDALNLNIPSKYLVPYLNVDAVMLDPETGAPDPASVQKVVEDYQKEHAPIIQSFAPKSKSPSAFPANTSATKLTPQEYAKLSYEEQKARKGEVSFN